MDSVQLSGLEISIYLRYQPIAKVLKLNKYVITQREGRGSIVVVEALC
jgi:hypothetical protein